MLDFGAHPFIALYVILLLVSGVAMVALSAMDRGGQSVGWRIFGGLAGLAFLGYGVYLGFFYTGGEYLVSLKAIVLPFLLLAGAVSKLRAGRAPDAAAPELYLPQQQPRSAVQAPGLPYAAQPQADRPPFGQQPVPGPYDQLPRYQPVPPPAPYQPAQYRPAPYQPAQYRPAQPQPVQAQQPYDAAPPPPPAPQGPQG